MRGHTRHPTPTSAMKVSGCRWNMKWRQIYLPLLWASSSRSHFTFSGASSPFLSSQSPWTPLGFCPRPPYRIAIGWVPLAINDGLRPCSEWCQSSGRLDYKWIRPFRRVIYGHQFNTQWWFSAVKMSLLFLNLRMQWCRLVFLIRVTSDEKFIRDIVPFWHYRLGVVFNILYLCICK